jgi:O-antigen ligase
MAFWLFILLNAVLFIRPAELVPAVRALPIYQIVILACIAANFQKILDQLDLNRLKRNPISACVVGMLAAVALSHMSHLYVWGTRYYTTEFSKTIIYYLVMLAVITSVRRLEQFFVCLLGILTVMAALSLAHHYEIIYIPELDSLTQREFDPATGQFREYARMQSTGIFSDPNDFGMILVVGVVLALHRFGAAGFFGRVMLIVLAALFAYCLILTKSRGAALAFVAAGGTLVYSRWGFHKAIYASALLVPVAGAIFMMRDDGGVESGTGQARVQLWAEGISLVQQAPLFGVGSHSYAEEVGQVAHNSFVHCYAELGLIGGTVFFGCFYCAFMLMWQQIRDPAALADHRLRARTATALAILSGFTVSMLTLSRAYFVPTYMVLGICAATVRLNGLAVDLPLPRLNVRFAKQMVTASALFFVATYIYIRIAVRWS